MNVPIAATGPAPLREGTVLDERFAVGTVLGRGGFGITYLVEDLARGDRAIVNELVPLGSSRDGDDIVFHAVGPAAGQRLRHLFTSEARLLQRFRVPRVPQYRAVFHEHGTAYIATDYIEGAKPLTELIGGPLFDVVHAKRILELLMETLEAVHNHALLHQDVKPSNILIAPSGDPYLVDFGSARRWHADLTIAHDVQFSSEYAAVEQLNERARHTTATDLYGLGATTYTLLTGAPPTSATLRRDGAPLIPLRSVRPDVHEDFATAVEQLLSLDPDDRPQSVAELRALLSKQFEEREVSDRVRELDAKRRRLKRFRYDPMQCPACGDVLAVPEPLAPETCPVCQDGKIKRRRIEEKACPSCGAGVLRMLDNSAPLQFCPGCSIGRMVPKRRFLKETGVWTCEKCEFTLERTAMGAKDNTGNDMPWEEWRKQSGRQERVMYCEACLAQFDSMPDGRWQRMTPNMFGQEWTRLYPDEWARVAAGLAPDSGNASCESCGADYFLADGCITLLSDPLNDPHGFASHYCGHLIPINELPFLAVGKESGHKGLVCRGCRLEFDSQGQELKLVRSTEPRLRKHSGESHRLKDWHRIAQDLPKSGDEDELSEDIAGALVVAFGEGEIGFDAKNPDLIWKGPAAEVHGDNLTGRPQRLIIDDGLVSFGGLLRRRSELLRDVVRVEGEGEYVTLRFLDGEKWSFRIEPVKLTFKLESGKDEVELGAAALAKRLSAVTKRSRG